MINDNYRPGIFIVTYRFEKNKIFYLLLKRKLHWQGWEFPKGGIEKNETKIQTVKREIKEETGLKIKKIRIYKLSGKYNYHKKFIDRPNFKGQTYTLYSAEVYGSKVKIDEREHNQFKWLEFEEAYRKLTWKNQKKSLKKVNQFVSQ